MRRSTSSTDGVGGGATPTISFATFGREVLAVAAMDAVERLGRASEMEHRSRMHVHDVPARPSDERHRPGQVRLGQEVAGLCHAGISLLDVGRRASQGA